MLNFLYNPETSRITALVDWSFSHVASLSDECFYSFPDLFHIVTPEDPASPMNNIRKAVLHGVDAVTRLVHPESEPKVDVHDACAVQDGATSGPGCQTAHKRLVGADTEAVGILGVCYSKTIRIYKRLWRATKLHHVRLLCRQWLCLLSRDLVIKLHEFTIYFNMHPYCYVKYFVCF